MRILRSIFRNHRNVFCRIWNIFRYILRNIFQCFRFCFVATSLCPFPRVLPKWVTVVGWGFANGRCGPPAYIHPNNYSWPSNIASEKVGDCYFIGSEVRWVDQDIFLELLTTVVVKETSPQIVTLLQSMSATYQ